MCIRCAAVKSERDEEERGDGGGGPGTHVQLSCVSPAALLLARTQC